LRQDAGQLTGLGEAELAPERDEHVDTRGAADLHEGRQLDARAESADLPCDPDDVLERRALGIEVEDAPVRVLG
jgi:hypothetical protein